MLHCQAFLKSLNGEIHLSISHAYYDQIQGQLAVSELSFCDFVCWTTKGMFIERIYRNEEYFTEVLPKLQLFFCHYVLPEIMTRRSDPLTGESTQTHPSSPKKKVLSTTKATSSDTKESIYCICKTDISDMMIDAITLSVTFSGTTTLALGLMLYLKVIGIVQLVLINNRRGTILCSMHADYIL